MNTLPCEHGRQYSQICPHCLGLNELTIQIGEYGYCEYPTDPGEPSASESSSVTIIDISGNLDEDE